MPEWPEKPVNFWSSVLFRKQKAETALSENDISPDIPWADSLQSGSLWKALCFRELLQYLLPCGIQDSGTVFFPVPVI